jgi:hypothetical protein
LEEQSKLVISLKEAKKAPSKFMGKYDEARILTEVKELLNENEHLKAFGRELKAEIEYSKQ